VIIGITFLCVLVPAWSFPASASGPAIKIGVLYPFTGPYTFLGTEMLRGWELALGQVNYKIAGRPVELIVEDTKADPSVSVTKVNKLIQKDQVHILGGVVSSAVAYAIRDVVEQSRVPLVITMANAGGLTREKRSPFIFRTCQPGGTGSHYIAQYLYEDLKLRTAVVSAADYAYGRDHADMFKKEFERLGGKVLFESFAPLGTANFGPYITKLAEFAGKAEILHFVYAGADGIRFVKTAGEYGLNKKFTYSNWACTMDGSELKEMGAAAEGAYLVNAYIFGVPFQANKHFLNIDKQKGGTIGVYDVFGYLGAQVVLNALEKIQGKVESKEEFLKALREVRFESPVGPFQFDARSQNALVNIFIAQAKKVKGEFGEYQNVLVKTIPRAQDPWWLEQGR